MPSQPRLISVAVEQFNVGPHYDEAPYIEIIKFAMEHKNQAEVDLADDERVKMTKIRLSKAARKVKGAGAIRWLSTPEDKKRAEGGVLRFQLRKSRPRNVEGQSEDSQAAS